MMLPCGNISDVSTLPQHLGALATGIGEIRAPQARRLAPPAGGGYAFANRTTKGS